MSRIPFYSSEVCARHIATANGFVDGRNWHWVNASDEHVRAIGSADLVMSLLSWGFHYPVETYLDAARSILTSGGREGNNTGILVLTLRNGQGQESTLAKCGFRCNASHAGFNNRATLLACRATPSSSSSRCA